MLLVRNHHHFSNKIETSHSKINQDTKTSRIPLYVSLPRDRHPSISQSLQKCEMAKTSSNNKSHIYIYIYMKHNNKSSTHNVKIFNGDYLSAWISGVQSKLYKLASHMTWPDFTGSLRVHPRRSVWRRPHTSSLTRMVEIFIQHALDKDKTIPMVEVHPSNIKTCAVWKRCIEK